MSLRTDFEVFVKIVDPPNGKFTEKALRDLAANGLDNEVGFYCEDPEADDEYLVTDDDLQCFNIMLRETHPEIFDLTEFSKKFPELTLEVEEYVHQNTEMVESGRTVYRLKNGDRLFAGLQADVLDLMQRLEGERMQSVKLMQSYHVNTLQLPIDLVNRLRKAVNLRCLE